MVKARPNTLCDNCKSPCYVFPKRLRNNAHSFCSKWCLYDFRRKQYPERNRICIQCGRHFVINSAYLRRKNRKGKIGVFCSVLCMKEYHETNTVRSVSKMGYIEVWDKSRKRRVREHQFLMEKKLGRKLAKGECVHHLDLDKTNNDLSNLILMNSTEHHRLHALIKRIGIEEAYKSFVFQE